MIIRWDISMEYKYLKEQRKKLHLWFLNSNFFKSTDLFLETFFATCGSESDTLQITYEFAGNFPINYYGFSSNIFSSVPRKNPSSSSRRMV